MEDPAFRAAVRVTELRATAMLSTTPPAAAETLLTEAITLRTTQSDPVSLPGLLLLRTRARRQTGDLAGAVEDVERGIAELERRRETLPEGEARWGAFHGAEELFEHGIELALADGDHNAAFRFAERARARALLDAYQRRPVLDYSRLPAGTLVVEYASLPSQLVVFTADQRGVHATRVPVARETLRKEATAFLQAIRNGDTAAGAAVYRYLIAPIAARTAGSATVAFIPDPVTAGVPFAALRDERGAFLVQHHAIVVSPSAAVFVAAAERRQRASVPESALLISAAEAAQGLDALARVGAELAQIALAYPRLTRIDEAQAQFDELQRHGADADVIHFGGHAVGDDGGLQAAALVLRQNGGERRVTASEIARVKLRRPVTVVLAGCSTAQGERRAAEGVISVAHGFLSAGAPSVIATLWPIDDSRSSTFYPRVHRYLAAGLAPAEAVRQAQLESIRKGDVPPSLWAAVQDIGS